VFLLFVQEWQSNYHELELSYVFASPFTGFSLSLDTAGAAEGYTDVDQRLSKLMMMLWTNFAKYG